MASCKQTDDTSDTHSLAPIPDNISVSFLPDNVNVSQRNRQRGLNYYTQGYIHNIRVFDDKNGTVRVTAKCWRSMRKSQPPHQVHMEIKTSTSRIEDSFCSCKAGISGHCSHAIGLIKSLQGLKLHNFSHVPEKQSCTNVPQQWHVPRGDKIEPVPLNHVVVARPKETRKRQPVVCHFDINYSLPKVTEGDLSQLRALKGTPLTNIQTNVPVVHTVMGDVPLGSVLSYQTRNLKRKQPSTQQQCGQVGMISDRVSPVQLPAEFKDLNTMGENFDPTELEKRTRSQASSAEWKAERAKRLTSSNFGKVVHRKSVPTSQFLSNLFPITEVKAASLEYGKRNESVAKSKYLEKFPDNHMHECGLLVNREFDFLGSSPDGIVCENGQTGLVEIKCPFKARHHMVSQACVEIKDFCLQKKEGKIALKETHDYYAQVQGQLMISGSSFCDFVVYTKKDLHVERILPNIPCMKDMLQKLSIFHKNHLLPFFESRN